MKLIDYIIIAAFLAALSLGWLGYRLEAGLAITAIVVVASWRFWDQRQARKLPRAASGDNVPDLPDSASSGEASSGGGGGDD
ncbi:MAG TPA: hypothetical protein VNT99_14240 [Methylomirabilota bacterium]|nr:hypothetical protein [Methylomirabilota bacterium]